MPSSLRFTCMLILLILCSAVLSGCGTYLNVTAKEDPQRPSFVFGGVARDVGVLVISSIPLFLDSGTEEDEEDSSISNFDEEVRSDDGNAFKAFFLASLIDLPLSLVGDIVTLPLILDTEEKDPTPRYEEE